MVINRAAAMQEDFGFRFGANKIKQLLMARFDKLPVHLWGDDGTGLHAQIVSLGADLYIIPDFAQVCIPKPNRQLQVFVQQGLCQAHIFNQVHQEAVISSQSAAQLEWSPEQMTYHNRKICIFIKRFCLRL